MKEISRAFGKADVDLHPTSTILLAQSSSLQRNNRFNRQFCCLSDLLNREIHAQHIPCCGDGFDFSNV